MNLVTSAFQYTHTFLKCMSLYKTLEKSQRQKLKNDACHVI